MAKAVDSTATYTLYTRAASIVAVAFVITIRKRRVCKMWGKRFMVTRKGASYRGGQG